ncbi:MAG: hypothetical protein OC190_02700 [Novosphingobium aromaticivorans]|nr:hypothetical protein [Novosphingobium aromaticivorans]
MLVAPFARRLHRSGRVITNKVIIHLAVDRLESCDVAARDSERS